MTHELYWGLPVILYLFLAGMGAGAVAVSATAAVGGAPGRSAHSDIARYGAFLGPLPVIIGCGLLILELSSFQTGHWFRFINLFLTVTLSPMSIGSWLLMLFIATSVIYAWTYVNALAFPFGDRMAWRRGLAWANIPLGLAVAIYTGVLLGAMPARPFWNSAVLPLLFMFSGLSTGTALIILVRALLGGGEEAAEGSGYVLATTDVLIVGLELLTLFLFVLFAYLTIGNTRTAIEAIMPGGALASLFWVGIVIVGLLLPGLLELYFVIPSLLGKRRYAASRSAEFVVAAAILLGGLLLRYVVVVAGQITGPVGL